ncbi:MAG: tetratricopeptide repeat protein, partial [Bacteroidales bacterium]|nr:tetratricopeptide repeat protein [Bacteroidales bacterium]
MKTISKESTGLKRAILGIIYTLAFLIINLPDNDANYFNTDSTSLIKYEDSSKIYNNLGREYMINGNFELAGFYLKKSLDIKRNYLKHDIRKIASGYVNLGANYYSMWKFDEALLNYNMAEEIYFKDIGDFQTEMGILETNKGMLLSNIGDYHNAKFHFEMALKYFTNTEGLLNKKYKTFLLNSMGIVFIRLKEYGQAIYYLNECIALSIHYNPDMVAICNENLAYVFNEMGGFSERAEYYYKVAIDYNIKNKGYEHYQLIGLFNNYADFLVKEKKYPKAREYYLKSLNVSEINNIRFHPSKAYAYLGLGDIFLAASQPDSALYYYQRSIAALVPGFDGGDPDIEKTISKTHLLKCLKQRAAAYYQRYNIYRLPDDLVASLKSYDIAIRLIDLIRLGYQDQDSKLFLAENEENTYHEALYTAQKLWGLTSDRYYLNKAF